jgi:predicted GNAT family N-acyltransferase
MSSEFHIERVDWKEHQTELEAIRDKVFVVEQGIPKEIESDGQDPEAWHFIGFHQGEAVACARLLYNGKIGRMSVLPQYRGLHFGRMMLDYIVSSASELGISRLYLHAQAHAAGFYRRAGFEVQGEPFDEADIPHIAMQLTL